MILFYSLRYPYPSSGVYRDGIPMSREIIPINREIIPMTWDMVILCSAHDG